MIYLHKILPYFFMPLTLAILLFAAGLLLNRRIIIFLGLCVLIFFSTPFVSNYLYTFMEANMERLPADEVHPADAIVVLSGAGISELDKAKVVEWNDPNRFLGGVQLFKSGKAPLLIFTGGWVPWDATARPEGEILIEQARLLGIPEEAMMTTRKVSNTAEEALGVSQVLCERIHKVGNLSLPRPRILLVTSAYHMPRARLIFEKAGMEVTPFPVDFRRPLSMSASFTDLVPNSGALGGSDVAIRELYGRWYYQLKP